MQKKKLTPWQVAGHILHTTILSILAILMAAILVLANTLLPTYGRMLNEIIGYKQSWKTPAEGNNLDLEYSKADYSSADEIKAAQQKLNEQIVGEGTVMLKGDTEHLPYAAGTKFSLFSHSSVDYLVGGYMGSGVSLKSALESRGFTVNDALWNFYSTGNGKTYTRGTGSINFGAAEDFRLNECPIDVITGEAGLTDTFADTTAVFVLSRVVGEGRDMPRSMYNHTDILEDKPKSYLEPDSVELGIIDYLNKNFKDVVVLINSPSVMETGWVENYENIHTVLYTGLPGSYGLNAVADILAGNVNPSGHLVDTAAYDAFSSPATQNYGSYYYFDEEGNITPYTYLNYAEGIYVGYKYYETRYEDAVMKSGNAGDYDYRKTVQYPFGYGLSLTTFDWKNYTATWSGDTCTVSVTVTNTGDVAGKEVVQVYAQSPYTEYDKENGVEKSAVSLVGFGKTGSIEPGASETLSMTVNKRDIASYDTYGAGTYILDAGDYYFTAATDAHDAVNNILAAKGYTVESTNGKMTADGNADLTYTWTEDALDTTTYATSENGTAITNQLSCADPNLYEGVEETVTWLSRSDWNGTLPTETVKLTLTELLKKDLKDIRYDPADYKSVEMPTLGAKNGVKLYDMIGLDYNDPKWDELLDQMTFDEMNSLIGDAFHWTMPVKSVEAPGTRDENGPQGLTASLLGNDKTQLTATAFTSEDVMAATFNTEIMTEIGKVIGNNCLEADIACLYGPGNNIHRTPYGGRNFEYYSEDGFLSGMMSAYEVAAIQAKGVHVVMKHFALNDCEQDRIGLGVWLNEQAAREVYLKAFQAPVEVGNGNGVMIAYTRWGAVWSGGNYGLVTGILRNEWGCDGMVITDNVLTQYVNGPDGVLAGVSIYDAMMSFVTDTLPQYKNDPVIVTAMREACHHNLYAIANSCGMNGVGADTTIKVQELPLVSMLKNIARISAVLFIVFAVLWVLGGKKFRKTEEYKAYKDFKKSLKAAKKA